MSTHLNSPAWLLQARALYYAARSKVGEAMLAYDHDELLRATASLYKQNVRWISAEDSENHWFAVRVPSWTHLAVYAAVLWSAFLLAQLFLVKPFGSLVSWVLRSTLRTLFAAIVFYAAWSFGLLSMAHPH